MDILEMLYTECVGHILSSSLLDIVGVLAVIVCLAILFKALVWMPFKLYFLAQVLPGVDLKKLGRWAVITGATDGIGKGYAKVLAERGLAIVLISRSAEKLTKVAHEITAEYKVNVKTIAADFNSTDIYERLREELQELDIAVLVNNVGVGTETTVFHFTANILKTTVDIAHVNCVSMTNMCALVLPQMLEKNKGAIINISSIGQTGYVGASIYSASKAYVSRMSDCLQRTYKNSGVIIQTVEPGMVLTSLLDTGFTTEYTPDVIIMAKKYTSVSAGYFAKSAVNTIGWANVSNGCLIHYYLSLIMKYGPESSSDDSILKSLPQ